MAQQVEGEEWWHSEGSDDDDDEGGALPSRGKQRAREDTEFFDPKMDEKDERWMEKMRGGRTSDAILSCPCCLETLCLDCQRHAKYPTQFRAMFVYNCKLRKDQRMRTKAPKSQTQDGEVKASNARAAQQQQQQVSDDDEEEEQQQNMMEEHQGMQCTEEEMVEEVFIPVECLSCGTEVGLLDENEVYHFFHVIESCG